MIKKLELKNFRGFEEIAIDGFRPITLIAGKNNVGKSSILESLFLYMNRYYSDVFFRVNGMRSVYNYFLEPKLIWEPLFHNYNVLDKMEIGISFDDSRKERLFFHKEPSADSAFAVGESAIGGAHHIKNSINTYILSMNSHSDEGAIFSAFRIENNMIHLEHSDSRQSSNIVPSFFLAAQSLDNQQLAEWFSLVDYAGDKERCIAILKEIDRRIKDISILVMGGQSYIYVTTEHNLRVPTSFLGDGINRLLKITLAMMANPQSLILIDEIETGFHYTFLDKLWRVISKTVSLTRCQLITTTHSKECVGVLADFIEETQDDEIFRFMRLDYIDGQVIPKVFENDVLVTALQHGMEVR